MEKFKNLCEGFKVHKSVKREYYPRQINFSPQFLEAVEAEYARQQIDEDSGSSIKNCRSKFVKALNFHLRQVDEGTINEDTQEKVLKKQRKIKKQSTRKRPSEVKKRIKANMDTGISCGK